MIEFPPRVLVLTRRSNGCTLSYCTSRHTIDSMLPIVEGVIGKTGREQPISDGQVTEIERRAKEEGAVVKIVDASDKKAILELAMLGECDIPDRMYQYFST